MTHMLNNTDFSGKRKSTDIKFWNNLKSYCACQGKVWPSRYLHNENQSLSGVRWRSDWRGQEVSPERRRFPYNKGSAPHSSHTEWATEPRSVIHRRVFSAIAMRITYFLFLVVENGNLSNTISWHITFELKKKNQRNF